MSLTTKTACAMARKLAGVTEKDHFGSDAFYANKRIFATVWHDKGEVNLRFTPEQQQEFLGEDGDAFSEIENGFGRMGWTTCHLAYVDKATFARALAAAHASSAQKRKR